MTKDLLNPRNPCIGEEHMNKKPFTYRIPVIKLAGKELKDSKFYASFLALMMLVGTLCLSPAISQLMTAVRIGSSGSISPYLTASSGSAADIQAAVNMAAALGGGDVHIPEGTFNFVEVGEPWVTVNIPAGVNLFGAPTDRDSNDQVIEWKTTLVMPYEVPTSGPDDRPRWFAVQGNGIDSFRFSDIELIGWREFDSSSITQYTGVGIFNVQDFRVDHSHFKNIAGSAILATDGSIYSVGGVNNGVIDHNRLVNDIGDPGYPTAAAYLNRTLGYGIALYGEFEWNPNLEYYLGHDTDYTVFIENNYFSKWRHSISSNYNMHYVARYNTVQYDNGTYSFDAHGANELGWAGTRATEIYGNTFIDALNPYGSIQITGGGGVIFNNTAVNYNTFVYFSDRGGTTSQTMVNDYYVWNNNLTGMSNYVISYGSIPIVEGVNYFLYERPNYTPYIYPHPLTVEGST
jgi:hypothetical protein